MQIIGFIGRINSGKTTCAKYLEQKYGFTRLSFASSLKKMLVKAGIVTWEDIENKTSFAREMMQKIGTNLIRNQIDPDFWIKKLVTHIIDLKKKGYTNFVIDDVRFPNEADAIKKINGFLIKLERTTSEKNNHESECYIDTIPYDYLLINNASIENLYETLDSLIKSLSSKTIIRQ